VRALVVTAAILALPATAWPCDPVDGGWWEPDPREVGVDLEPPGPARLQRLVVVRGMQAIFDGGPADSCNEWEGQRGAQVLVHLDPPVDDRTPSREIGFRIELAGSHLPPGYRAGMSWEEGGWGSMVRLPWNERDDDDLLDFTMRITPLDRAGNEGPTLEVHVRDEGVGCSAAGGGAGLLPLLVACLALIRRR